MSQPKRHDALHSLDLVRHVIAEATGQSQGKCGGDCNNCPCSAESPKSSKKAHEQESSEACDKC